MSAYVPVSSTQLFDVNSLVNGLLQNADGTTNNFGLNSGYFLSASMHVVPGAHLTWAAPASLATASGAGLFYGSGGPFPCFEFFADAGMTSLVGVDSTAINGAQQNNYTTVVPAGANYARAQFNANPSNLAADLQGGTITTDTPLPVAPTIAFSIPNHATTDSPFTVAATSNSAGAFTYSIVSGPASVSGNTVTLTGATGTVVVQASQAAAAGYTTGTQNASLTVAPPVTPTITFAVPSHTFGDPAFAVAATSNSPGAIAYAVVSGPATVSGNTVTLTGPGVVVLRASQAAAGGYGAFSASATFTVTAPTPVGYTPLTGLNFQDAAGNPLALGTLNIQPTDAADKPISATAGGSGGLISDVPVPIAITAGAISSTFVADTTLTKPPHISYRLTVRDQRGIALNIIKGFQPSGTVPINLDTFQPPASLQAPLTPGPSGVSATVAVGTVTTLPAGSAPSVTNSGTSSAAVLNFGFPAAPAGASALAGLKLAIFGDSITAIFANQWQNIVSSRLGLVQHFQDARPGRRIDQAFECYGAPSGGALSTNQGTVATPNGSYANNGTPGHTLAQDLAGCDFCVVFLGMNDQNVTNGGTYIGPGVNPDGSGGTHTGTLGSFSDTSSALTEYGFIRRFFETVLAAAPSIRIVTVILYQAASSWMTPSAANQLAAAYLAVSADYNQPCVNLLLNSGITHLNHSLTLQSDGIHPTTLGFSKYVGPTIAQGLAAVL